MLSSFLKRSFSYNFLLAFIAICFLGFFWIIYPIRLPIIYQTHSLVANLDIFDTDTINQFYLLIRTPVYSIFKPIFLDPTLFVTTSFLIEFSFPILILIFLFSYSKNSLSALLTILIFSPLVYSIFNNVLDFNFLKSTNLLGWGTTTFSVRYLTGLFFLTSIFCYLKKYYLISFFFASICLVTHPNTGIFISIFFICFEIYVYFFKKENSRNLIIVLILSFLFFVPNLLNILNLTDLKVDNILTNYQWYDNMIRDEIDDFSPTWNLLNDKFTSISHISIILFTLFFYFFFEKIKSIETDFLIFLISLPLLSLIFFIIIELIMSHTNYLLAPILISLQPSKLLVLSIFPLMFFWSKYFAIFIKNYLKYEKFLLMFIIIIFLVGVLFSKNSLKTQIEYFKSINKIKINSQTYFNFLLNYAELRNDINPTIPNIYYLDDFYFTNAKVLEEKNIFQKIPDEVFYQKYSSLETYKNLNKLIRENIDIGSDIIIPPYLIHIRDILPEYNIFFQERHDGNISLGGKKIFEEIEKRMNLLIGTNYTSLPLRPDNDLTQSYMRKLFLDRNVDHFLKLNKDYANFNLLLTEISHQLDFDVIAKNDNYIIYKID